MQRNANHERFIEELALDLEMHTNRSIWFWAGRSWLLLLTVVIVIVVTLIRYAPFRVLVHLQGRLLLCEASCAWKAVETGASSLVHNEQMMADASSRGFEGNRKGSCLVWDFD